MSCLSRWQALKLAHTLVALLLLVATITLMALALGAPADRMPLHLTSTFLTAYHTDDPSATWVPPHEPSAPAQIADTYYACLHSAAVGFAAPVDCALDDLPAYRRCIDARTSSPEYRSRFVTMGAKEVVRKSQADVQSDVLVYNAVMQALASPQALLAASVSYLDQDTVYARGLYDLLARASNFRGVAGCLSRVDQDPAASRAVPSLYSDLWDCTASVLHTDPAQAGAFHQCVPLSPWPTLDVMQTPYSTVFLGSYNKAFVLLVAMWLLTSFAVYTAWLGVETPPTTGGKPAALLARCGMGLTVFCALWNGLGGLVLVLVKAFAPPLDAGGFPMTLQTVLVTGVAALLGAGYFLRELWEQAGPAPDRDPASVAPGMPGASRASVSGGYTRLAAFVRAPAAPVSVDLQDQQYAPLLAPAWSDAWLICDGLFLVGVIGTSNDVVSGELVRCFLFVLYAAAAHTAFTRLFYEGYVNDVANKRDQRQAGITEASRRGLHITTLLANLAALAFAFPLWLLVVNRYAGSPLICTYVVFTSLIPRLAWLGYTICVDYDILPAALAAVAQMAFIYSGLVRAVFVFIIAVAATADADANARLARMLSLLE